MDFDKMAAKYTSKGLPVVSKETLDAYTKSGSEVGEEEHLRLIKGNHERIKQENPIIKQLLDDFVKVAAEEIGDLGVARTLIYLGATETYAILGAQAEANKLEEKLG